MTYKNAVKRICAMSEIDINSVIHTSDIRSERVRELVLKVSGAEYLDKCVIVCVSGRHNSGYAAAMLESVLKDAGHCVGRVGVGFIDDFREQISVNCQSSDRTLFADTVAEIVETAKELGIYGNMAPIEKLAVTAFGIFSASKCDIVIINSEERVGGLISVMSALGVPKVELIVGTATANESEERPSNREFAFRRGTAEVVSVPQSKEVYSMISDSCATVAARLTVPVRSELSLTDVYLTRCEFSYHGRDGYVLRNANDRRIMTSLAVVESCYALRRTGIIIPSACIMSGIASYNSPCEFDIVSASPAIIAHHAESREDIEVFFEGLSFIENNPSVAKDLIICLPDRFCTDLPPAPNNFRIDRVVFISDAKKDISGIMEEMFSEKLGESDHTRSSSFSLVLLGGLQFVGKARHAVVAFLNENRVETK